MIGVYQNLTVLSRLVLRGRLRVKFHKLPHFTRDVTGQCLQAATFQLKFLDFNLINLRNSSHSSRVSAIRRVQSTPLSASSTQHMWELVAGNRTAVLPRHALF